MSRLRPSETLRCLKERHSQLCQEWKNQVDTRRALLIRDGLLNAMCESLSFIQLAIACGYSEPHQEQLLGTQQQQQQQQQTDKPMHQQQDLTEVDQQKFDDLLKSEVKLLQQLTTKSQLGECQQTLAQLLQPEEGTISPCTDPMRYLHRYVSMAPMKEAATMTAEDVAAVMCKTTQSISIRLHQLDTCTDAIARAGLTEQIADIWDRYMHMMGSLIIPGRQDVVEQAHCINLETMVSEPAEAAAHQAAQAAALVPVLGLSEQQQEFVAIGMELYYDLLAAIHQERQQINVQMTAAEGPDLSARLHNEDSMEVGSPMSGSSSEQLDALSDRQELLEKQQELTSRLALLLHKEYKLRLAAMGWFLGALTYRQLSRLAVMSYPYAMRVLFLATEIMQQRKKLLSCQQQPSS